MSVSKVATPPNCSIVVYAHDESGRCMDTHGFTVTCCGKCGGHGYLAGYEFSDGARCWKCGARGYYYADRVMAARSTFLADLKGGKATDIDIYWKAARSKIEDDVAEKLREQISEYNVQVSA